MRYYEWLLYQHRKDNEMSEYKTCKACKRVHPTCCTIKKPVHFGPANHTLYYCSQKCVHEDHLAWLAGRLNE